MKVETAKASLRAAFSGYPVLLAQAPDTPGPVEALPFGLAKLAVLKNKRVTRQGAFSAQEMAEARRSDA